MQIVTDVQHIVVAVEHRLYDLSMAQKKLDRIKTTKNITVICGVYDWFILCLFCSPFWRRYDNLCDHLYCFCHCHVCSTRNFRTSLQSTHRFAITAFVASLISGVSLKYSLEMILISHYSSVLLLVPVKRRTKNDRRLSKRNRVTVGDRIRLNTHLP